MLSSSVTNGAPAVFSLIAFIPALLNMKERMAGYRGYKIYVDISSHENSPVDQFDCFLELES